MKSRDDNKPESKIWSLSVNVILLVLMVSSLVISIILLIVSNGANNDSPYFRIFRLISDSLLVSSIIGFVFEKIIRKKNDAKIDASFNMHIKDLKSDLPDLVSQSIFSHKNSIINTLSDEVVDNIFLACLENKLKDNHMALQLNKSYFCEIFKYRNRWRDLNHRISVEEIIDDQIEYSIKDKYWKFTDHVSYSTKLTTSNIRFICLKKYNNFFNYLKDEHYHSVWGLRSAFDDNLKEHFFYIADLRINGKTYNIRKVKDNQDIILFESTFLNSDDYIHKQEEVQINYTVISLIRKESNAMSIQVPIPSWGVRVTFDFVKVNIGRLTVFPHFTTESSINITPSEDTKNKNCVEVHLSDWVFPLSGITCVWQKQKL